MCERECVGVHACARERERESVCVCMYISGMDQRHFKSARRIYACVCERGCVCVYVRVWVCMRV